MLRAKILTKLASSIHSVLYYSLSGSADCIVGVLLIVYWL